MKEDPTRKPGFYWVRAEGEVQVAEWSGMGVWHQCGSDLGLIDAEVCELLSERLQPPKTVR